MPACNATYKSGITFDGWSTRPGFESYFHPFASMLDNLTMTQFVDNVHARLNDADVHAHPDRFFIAARWRARSGAQAAAQLPVRHLVRLSLRLRAARGVPAGQGGAARRPSRCAPHDLRQARRTRRHPGAGPRGGDTLEADFFVDCTGFASLLIGKALQTPYVSFADNLFNDAAVAMPSPADEAAAVADGLHGDAPRLGLEDPAHLAHRQRLRLQQRALLGRRRRDRAAHPPGPARRRRAGTPPEDARRPLHAGTGIAIAWPSACRRASSSRWRPPRCCSCSAPPRRWSSARKGRSRRAARAAFNERVNAQFEGTRDYIVTHYKTNTRTDTDVLACQRGQRALSDPLRELLGTGCRAVPSCPASTRAPSARATPRCPGIACSRAWACSRRRGCGSRSAGGPVRPGAMDQLIERSALNFPDHRTAGGHPARVVEKSMQIYLW